jgi:hypothetical protein
MSGDGRLASAEFLGDQQAAHPVIDKTAIGRLAEMRARRFKPMEDL